MSVVPINSHTAQIVDSVSALPDSNFYEPSDNDKKLIKFVIDHTDRWREYRDQNFLDEYMRYERIWRGIWHATDKDRASERSRVISPATQQAVETRHAEIMEAAFGQGEFFDIEDADDDADPAGPINCEKLKNQLSEDFKRDKVSKAFDAIALLAEVYGTGIGEITVSEQKTFKPMEVPISMPPAPPGQMQQVQVAHGAGEVVRTSVRLVPVNPKNFLYDPNGTEIDDCMGCAIERPTSIHKVARMIASKKYLDVNLDTMVTDSDLEETQQDKNFDDDKVLLLTYYGLVPKHLLLGTNEKIVDPNKDEETGEGDIDEDDVDDYTDMVEAIVVIGNKGMLLKREESPYMMKDRPLISYQADTVPNRLAGRGTVEKALNMQSAIDGSMRSHMDSLALTGAPMIAIDATRLPRGAKYEVKPGKQLLTNGNPNEILMPFAFGSTDGMAMNTSKEFERMLLMATGTVDSNGTVTQVARDGDIDMATATLIKKYKRALVNFQEDLLIPFINKAAWRYMQFDPKRYPSVSVKFVPTGALGIIAREFEQKRLAFMAQTLGANSPITPIILKSILHNSSLMNREELIQELMKASQPDPQQQAQEQAQTQLVQTQSAVAQADVRKKNAEADLAEAQAQMEPILAKAKLIASFSNNTQDASATETDFEQRAKMADLLIKEKSIDVQDKISQRQYAADMHKVNTDAVVKVHATNNSNLRGSE